MDFISHSYTLPTSNPYYNAGLGVGKAAKKEKLPLSQVWSAKGSMIVGFTKRNVANTLKNFVSSFNESQFTSFSDLGYSEESYDETQDRLNLQTMDETSQMLDEVDITAQEFRAMFLMHGRRRLQQRIVDFAMPFVEEQILNEFTHSKYPFLKKFALESLIQKIKEPQYDMNNYSPLDEFSYWISKQSPRDFVRWAQESPQQHAILGEGKHARMSASNTKQLGKLAEKQVRNHAIVFQYGKLSKYIYIAKDEGKSLLLYGAGREVGSFAGFEKKMLDKVWAIKLAAPVSMVYTKVKKLSKLLDVVWSNIQSDPVLKKDLYALMATEDAFRRSLQAKKNKNKELPF